MDDLGRVTPTLWVNGFEWDQNHSGLGMPAEITAPGLVAGLVPAQNGE